MTASGFGTAIYTNCGPDEGLDGIAGMQFQSCSPSVDRTALAVVRRHLLYEPPDRLIRDGWPVAGFPPSFAHVHDGVFATAAGLYVGREAHGARRQGNHLTHAIVTDDERGYRSVRPVQLFGAPFWRAVPAESKESEHLEPGWSAGPLDAARARQFVCAQPDGSALLAVILTALLDQVRPRGGTKPRRVLFIAEQHEPVLLWLTAATLLLPQREAVRLGFKVFTADPAHCSLPVVAVHPGWVTSAATVEEDRGYIVIDLVAHRWTALAPSAEAVHWADLFCSAGPDEVSEAVELARASGLTEETARELAVAAVLPGLPSLATADRIVHWLVDGPRALLDAYGGPLVTAIARLSDLDLVREVDTAANLHFPGKRDQVRLDLLQLELVHAAGSPGTHQPLEPRRTVSQAIRPAAVELVTARLREAKPPAFNALLRVSSRFGVPVPPDDVQREIRQFIAFWADHPGIGYEPGAWPGTVPFVEMLRAELEARLAHDSDVADLWCPLLPGWTPDRADITVPLERDMLAAAMADHAAPERIRIVRSMLRGCASGSAATSYGEVALVLWSRAAPSLGELRALYDLTPAGQEIDQALFTGILARAQADPADVEALELCGRLAEKQLLWLPTDTQSRVSDHYWLLNFEPQIGLARLSADSAARLAAMAPGVLNAHAAPLARGLLTASDQRRAQELLQDLPEPVVAAFLRHVFSFRERPLTPADVALVVVALSRLLTVAADSPEQAFDRALGSWYRNATRRQGRRVTKLISPERADAAANWKAYLAELKRLRLPLRRRMWARIIGVQEESGF